MLSLNHYRPLNAIMCFSFEFSVIFALTLTFCVILYVLPKLAARAYDISLHVFLFVLFVKHMIFLRTPNSEFSCSFIHNTLVVFFFFCFPYYICHEMVLYRKNLVEPTNLHLSWFVACKICLPFAILLFSGLLFGSPSFAPPIVNLM